MGQVISSVDQARSPGVYVQEIPAPRVIAGIALGRVGVLMQSEWGPPNTVVEPANLSEWNGSYFPEGAPRTSSGFIATTNRVGTPWSGVRVLGGAAGILPPDAPVLANVGTASTFKYKYVVVANVSTAHTQASAFATILTAQTDLSAVSSGVVLTWLGVAGATSYDVYRTFAGGGTTTAVGRIAAALNALTYTDVGTTADVGMAPPTTNTTGWAPSVCNVYDSSTATQSNSTPGNCVLKIVGKYAGTLLNAAAGYVIISAASDGNAAHFDMTATLTDLNGVTGRTVDASGLRGLQNTSTTIMPTPASIAKLALIGSVATVNSPATRPANGTYYFSGGSNGSAVAAADYNTALTALAPKKNILELGFDDCGDAIRPAVNAYVVAHVRAKRDRIGNVQSLQASDWSTVKTEVAGYRDAQLRFSTWVQTSDVNGNLAVTPLWSFMAATDAILAPWQTCTQRDEKTQSYYAGIRQPLANSPLGNNFDYTDETVVAEATEAGVVLPVEVDSGVYMPHSERTTSTTLNELFVVTQKRKLFLDKALIKGLGPWVNGANNATERESARQSVVQFLSNPTYSDTLIARQDASTLQTYPQWPIGATMFHVDVASVNNGLTIAAGLFQIAYDAVTPGVSERIVIRRNVGPNINVAA